MPIIQFLKRAPAGAQAPAGPAPSKDGSSATSVAGFVVAGVIVFGLVVWLAVHLYRKRLARAGLGPAFVSVRTIINQGQSPTEKITHLRPNPTSFSRDNIHSQIVFPRRALLGDAPEHEKVDEPPQPGPIPKPFSFALHSSSTPPGTPNRLSVARNSYAPSSRLSRFSVISTASSFNGSLASTTTAGGSIARSIRKIRQVFNPVLPDELLVTVGEQLMILQSFDDGWCVVGRESGLLMPRPKSLFGGYSRSGNETPTAMFGPETGTGVGTASGGNVELGMVPAWCFLKPVKGLRAERPVRSTSLGVTVQMDGPGSGRDELISWSNF